MKIYDYKTGKPFPNINKEAQKELRKNDPIKRNVEKSLDIEENSPMDPPEAYDETVTVDVSYDDMDDLLKQYMDEHKVCIEKIDLFEKAMVTFKENGYGLNKEINSAFGEFFNFFDNNILDHNQREERELFPLLHERLIESGERGEGLDPKTAVDMMEDDHIKFIQLGTLAFNLLGLASRLHDERSRTFVYDVAYNNGRELAEMLRLHIYREDNIVFPLAHKLIDENEFAKMRETI